MGRAVVYVAAAVLLGVVAMLPVIVFTPRRADQGYYSFAGEAYLQSKADVERLRTQYGLAKAPSRPFHIGLILAFSFVLALGVCLYSKRRIF